MKKETGYPNNQMHSRSANPEMEARGMGVKVLGRKGTYRYLTFGLLTLLISTSLAVKAFGGPFEDATAAIERGDYEEAYRLTKPLAEQGNAEAQFNLGILYANGQGVPQEVPKSGRAGRG
jgi:TPR repeat protein